MERRFLEECLAKGMSLEAIGREVGKHPSTVGYWLKKHGLDACGTEKYAGRGGLYKADLEALVEERLSVAEIAERLDRNPSTIRYWLRRAVAKRRRVVKRRLVEDAGGACVLCGYRRWPGALQFHHVDPGEKEFHIAQRGYSRSLTRSRAEVRKCVLLCANCHAEVEGGFATLPLDSDRAPPPRVEGVDDKSKLIDRG
jgi:transposase-like protein